MSSALPSSDVVALNPQLFITATLVGLVVLFALGIAALVLWEQRSADSGPVPVSDEARKHAPAHVQANRDRPSA